MKNKWFTKIAVLMGTAVLTGLTLTACGSKQEAPSQTVQTAEEQVQAAEESAEEMVAQIDSEVEDLKSDALTEEFLAEYTGEMDLAGSWEDEVSKRASMDVIRNDDGSYDLVVNWAGSATEKAVWQIHGTYDAASGMLYYENGAYSIHTWDEKDNETVSGEEVTKGSFMKEGDKLRWSDSKNTEDGIFVKMN